MRFGYTGFGAMGRRTRSQGGGYNFVNTAAATYIAAWAAEPEYRVKELYDTFFGELITADILAHADIAYVQASPAGHEEAAEINLTNPALYRCTAVGDGPDWEAGKGSTGNGSSTAWSTGWNPTSHAVNYQQDNASIWVWCNTSPAAANVTDVGNNSGTARANVYAFGTTEQVRGMLNDATLSSFGTAVPTAVGLSGISRASSASRTGWKNGASKGAVATTSTGLPNATQRICAANPSPWSTKQVGFAMWADALAGKEMALYEAVDNFMNGLTWITGDFIVLNGDSFGNSVFTEELELATGLPVYNISVGSSEPADQAIVFAAMPPLMRKYCILVNINGGVNPTDPATGVAANQAQADELASPKRFVVIEGSPAENAADTSYRTGVNGYDAQMDALETAFGGRFIRCLAALQALNDGSPEDLADVAADIVPRSLRDDQVHELQPALEKRAELVATYMQSQGWIA